MMKKKIIVVGSGPIGLNFAIKAKMAGFLVEVFEQASVAGGQITSLYQEKTIFDIPGIKEILAKDYVDRLLADIAKLDISITYNSNVNSFSTLSDKVLVSLNGASVEADYLVLCSGLGYYAPRKIGVENENNYQNILYHVKELFIFNHKNVVVLGGGDSAIDWTREISKHADSVKIVHRRNEFRGDITPLLNLKNVEIITPYNIKSVTGIGSQLDSLTIINATDETTKEIKVDYLLVNYGSLPPQKENFPIVYDGAFIKVESHFITTQKNVFAIGDINTYEGKTRRIAPSLEECDSLISYLLKLNS